MGTHIRIRRGLKKDMPKSVPSGMPLWCEDSKELFIGVGNSISKINSADADTLNGLDSSAFSRANHSHVLPPNYVFTYGSSTGTTTYAYPPTDYTMSNLAGFIPSIRTIHYNGDVDYNDSLYCYWAKDASKITITCYNSEQRANSQVNWLAIWRK